MCDCVNLCECVRVCVRVCLCVCVCVCAAPTPIKVTSISYGYVPHEYALALPELLPGGSVILEAGEASFNGTAEAGVVHARP